MGDTGSARGLVLDVGAEPLQDDFPFNVKLHAPRRKAEAPGTLVLPWGLTFDLPSEPVLEPTVHEPESDQESVVLLHDGRSTEASESAESAVESSSEDADGAPVPSVVLLGDYGDPGGSFRAFQVYRVPAPHRERKLFAGSAEAR